MLPTNHNDLRNLIRREIAQSELDKLALFEHLMTFLQGLLKRHLPVCSVQVEDLYAICA